MNDDLKQKNDIKEPEVDTDIGDDRAGCFDSDDLVFEDNVEVTGVDYTQKVQKLKDRIKELESKCSEYLNSWQKAQADFVNLRKRDEEEKKMIGQYTREAIISDIIPTLDSFENAMKNKQAWEAVDQNWRRGVEYIYLQLKTALETNGLISVYPLGQIFDHNRDEAVENIATQTESEDGKILDVVQAGYSLNDKIIRAPKVKVAMFGKLENK